MRKLLFAATAIVIFASCVPGSNKEKASASDFMTAPSENFTLRLPTYMSEAKNLNEGASLQYQNIIKNFYCIVIEESIGDVDTMLVQNELTAEYPIGIEGYSKLIRDQFIENTGIEELTSKTPITKLDVEGLDAMQFEADAAVDGLDIHYHYGLIKGATQYYQIITWTTVDKKAKFNDTIAEILKSFRERVSK